MVSNSLSRKAALTQCFALWPPVAWYISQLSRWKVWVKQCFHVFMQLASKNSVGKLICHDVHCCLSHNVFFDLIPKLRQDIMCHSTALPYFNYHSFYQYCTKNSHLAFCSSCCAIVWARLSLSWLISALPSSTSCSLERTRSQVALCSSCRSVFILSASSARVISFCKRNSRSLT